VSATDYAANIVRLEAALAKGVRTVESDGERITYATISELIAALDYNRRMQSEAAAPVGQFKSLTTVAEYSGD
jgi:hypothetical protein